jgi:ring-1,2-phenylacetyl-CoA epoxidase subunit PaaE
MGLFSRKKKEENKIPRGFYEVQIKELRHLTEDAVKVVLDIPNDLKDKFKFIPGQYLNFSITLNGEENRRSYSICSGTDEDLAIGVKAIDKGLISNYFKNDIRVGDTILCTVPEGNFKLEDKHRDVVAFAGGSGITPILSIAKKLQQTGGEMHLVYGNQSEKATMFKEEIDELTQVQTNFYYQNSDSNHPRVGLLDRETVHAYIQEHLEILKADAFFLCGPLAMIEGVQEKLAEFGVPKEKIKLELFTAPTPDEVPPATDSGEEMESAVTIILEGEHIELSYKPKGKGILDQLNSEGYDPPYSCRGGVCSSCKSKVLAGSAKMKLNYSLTDEEVAEGFILCCQAVPTSEKLTISFDE